MSDFEKIPEEVFRLFDEIMSAMRPVYEPREFDRGAAWMLAWGWNPPLMKLGSETELTPYGLAAYQRNRLHHEHPEQAYAEEDVPKEYREGGKRSGALLTIKYLKGENGSRWVFQESPQHLSNRLRGIRHVQVMQRGTPLAYHYLDLLKERDKDLSQVDNKLRDGHVT